MAGKSMNPLFISPLCASQGEKDLSSPLNDGNFSRAITVTPQSKGGIA